MADLTQINQLLLNIYTNAAHAMQEIGGVLEVSLIDIVIDEKEAVLNDNLTPGKYVTLSVRDTGHGIKPENIERIFYPYFTTKGSGEGTGVGLSLSLGIVKNHGGTITVESNPGHGAVFHVFFPVFDKHKAEDDPETEAFETLPTGNE